MWNAWCVKFSCVCAANVFLGFADAATAPSINGTVEAIVGLVVKSGAITAA